MTLDSGHLGIAPPGVYEIILQAIRPVGGLRILDIPSASGRFAEQLAREGALCVAADRVPIPTHKPSIVADMDCPLPFSDAAFDLITCIEGIEHTQSPFLLTREFSRLLRPGGRLIVTTPNIHNLRSRIKFLLRGTLYWFDPREVLGIGHISVIPYFILKHILALSGFEMVALQTNRAIWPSLPAWVARGMSSLFSKATEGDRELNSPLLLNGEGLIVFARKATGRGSSAR